MASDEIEVEFYEMDISIDPGAHGPLMEDNNYGTIRRPFFRTFRDWVADHMYSVLCGFALFWVVIAIVMVVLYTQFLHRKLDSP